MKVKLIIGNSYSKLENMSVGIYRDLRELLSYKVEDNFFAKTYNVKRHLLDKRGNFPTGLLKQVLTYLKIREVPYETVDTRTVPRKGSVKFNLLLPFRPYEEQVDAVRQACSHGRGTISMVTGFGKSITMAILIKSLGLKTLVVVPNLTLKNQLKENFTNYFGSLDNITIENIDSSNLENCKGYDCLIIDESHHVAANTYRILNRRAWQGIYYRFFFTGTPFRSKDEEQMLMESISGQVIYSINYQKAVEVGAIVPVESYFIDLPIVETSGFTWSEVYSDLVVNNSLRNAHIASILRKLNETGTSALCLVKEINHGRLLSKLTGVPFVCGEDKDSKGLIEEFNKGGSALIGTVGVLGEGCDTRPAEWIIIASLGKSRPQFMQMVGRGLRKFKDKESCKVLLFRDKSHKWTLTHFKNQVKFLKEEYEVHPIKLDFP